MLDSFETTEKIVVVTEYAPSDLHKLLAYEGSIGEERTQKLTFDLVSALYYLHSHRILHRDLKPQNILLDKNQKAILCDFGLARNMTMGTHVLTSIKGTPLYMAPELMAEKPYDHQADLWSLGCIIYEALAGQPPFSTNSILHLLRLMKQEDVKWPSFLSDICISFLQGLLEKDPTLRMIWPDILSHPFVKGHIVILDEDIPESPFTSSLTASQCRAKERQAEQIMIETSKQHQIVANATANYVSDMLAMKDLQLQKMKPRTKKPSQDDDLVSSRDSMNAILQSDLENIETDYEDVLSKKVLINPENEKQLIDEVRQNNDAGQQRKSLGQGLNKPPVGGSQKKDYQSVSAENLDKYTSPQHLPKRNSVQEISYSMSKLELKSQENQSAIEEASEDTRGPKINPPDVLPGWDSCDEPPSLSIENDEWLAFIHRSMQEVLDGELDSLKQQNLVSMIVAPLRNSKASCKVVESVAQLLSLPFVLGGPTSVIHEIRNVFVEVKLVPNLVYASKLLCHRRQFLYDKRNANNNNTPEEILNAPSPQNTTQPIRLCLNLTSILTEEDIKTLSSLYELVCHLIHMNDSFLTQFCDALAILGASNLLVQFISGATQDPNSIRLVGTLLAILSYTLREMPENADLVEKIVFDEKMDLLVFLRHSNNLLKYRTCMLLRLLGRFSCYTLQTKWSKEMGVAMENLLTDPDEQTRKVSGRCFR